MKNFIPNYRYIVDSARNIVPRRMPLYEHNISVKIMEKILGTNFSQLYNGNLDDKKEYFINYTKFFKQMGYDAISFERCIGTAMPGSGALGGHITGAIKTMKDFEKYPWDLVPEIFFDKYSTDFSILSEVMPEGMKVVGGPGNGVFECVQDIVGYTELSYISVDDPILYDLLFSKAGEMIYKIWKKFLKEFSHIIAVCRFGDDLGFKSATLLSPKDIKSRIIPQYRKIISLIHSYNKPFLLHSCGRIFDIMDDLIDIAEIDAKHSNEDQIAPFPYWIEKYGNRIALFGGIDTDVLCQYSESQIKKYVKDIIKQSRGCCGFAFGSGNSITDYVPVNNYIAMIESARESRKE